MASLSNLVNSISKGIHRTGCKNRNYDKNVKFADTNINVATVFLNTQTLKMIS